MVDWFKSARTEEMIEVRLMDGWTTSYEGRARVKNKKEVRKLLEDLEHKGLDTSIFNTSL